MKELDMCLDLAGDVAYQYSLNERGWCEPIDRQRIKSRSLEHSVKLARKIYYYMAYRHFDITGQEIAGYLKRDRNMVFQAYKKIHEEKKEQTLLTEMIVEAENKLRHYFVNYSGQ